MFDILIPIGIVLLGLVGLVVYVLAITVRDMAKRITSMNEKLMILVASKEGASDAMRALVASQHSRKAVPGIAHQENEKKEEAKGLRMTVGVR